MFNNINGINNSSNSKPILNKKIFNSILRIVIGAGLLVFIIIKVKPDEILAAVEDANLLFIFIACVLLVPNILLQFWKWKITCGIFLDDTSNKKIFFSLFHGLAGGAFTPVRVGEYFGRAIEFKDKPFVKVSVATFVDKLFPLLILAFFGSLTSILFIRIYYFVSIYIILSLLIIVLALFIIVCLLLLNSNLWDNALFNFIKSKVKPDSVWVNLKMLKSVDKKYSAMMIVISITFYICVLTQFAFLIAAFSHNMNFINYMWAGNLIMFAKSMIPSVTFADVGIREGASIFFLTKMGETSAAAFNASIFLFFINVLVPSLIGLLLLFKRSK